MKINPSLILTFALSTSLSAQEASSPLAAAPVKTREPLSKATLDEIAAMTPIFDGETLDGWIQSPINYTLAGSDVSNSAALAKKLLDKSDAAKSSLADLSAGVDTKAAVSALVKSINKVIAGPSIYDEKRFVGVRLSPETEECLKRNRLARS